MEAYLNHAIQPDRRQFMPPHKKEGVSGPELMELMRQQASNIGTRIITEDVVGVDLQKHPFELHISDGSCYEALAMIVRDRIGALPVVDKNGYGLRVPAMVISPWAKKGIDKQVLSHDAYLKFIEDVFLGGQRLDPKTDGRADPRPDVREDNPNLGDLRTEFDFTQAPLPTDILTQCPGGDFNDAGYACLDAGF
jgi:hypothetical protein